jgi:hypothetical protein
MKRPWPGTLPATTTRLGMPGVMGTCLRRCKLTEKDKEFQEKLLLLYSSTLNSQQTGESTVEHSIRNLLLFKWLMSI